MSAPIACPIRKSRHHKPLFRRAFRQRRLRSRTPDGARNGPGPKSTQKSDLWGLAVEILSN